MLDDPETRIVLTEKARQPGTKLIAASEASSRPVATAQPAIPADVVRAAKLYRDTAFVVHHSAIAIDAANEGEYNNSNTKGTDQLCRRVEQQ